MQRALIRWLDIRVLRARIGPMLGEDNPVERRSAKIAGLTMGIFVVVGISIGFTGDIGIT